MLSLQSFVTSEGPNSSLALLAESRNILALRARARTKGDLPGFVFVGDRQERVPVRLVIFAGGQEDDSVGSLALLKLLVDLDLAPLLAHDYALFCFLNFPRPGKSSFDFQRWNVRWGKVPLPEQLKQLDADGFISIRANDSVGGLRIEASDRTIANEVAWPAAVRASKIQPLDSEPVDHIQFDPRSGLGSEDWPSNVFKLAIRTPWLADAETQIAAIGIVVKEILFQYRSLRNFVQAL